MGSTFAGFRHFAEIASAPTTRPDLKPGAAGKNSLDLFGVQAMDLDVDLKALGSVPFVGAGYQLGKKVLGGLSSWTVVDMGDDTVTLELRDEGSKRFLRTPSGVLAKDPSEQDTPRRITMSRAYFARMCANQLKGAGDGAGGATPPLT